MKGIYEAYRDRSNRTLISENKNNACYCHFHRNLELLYVREGEMKAIVNGTEYVCGKDEIVFVPSFHSHEFSTPASSDVFVFIIPHELLGDFSTILHKKTFPVKLSDKEFNTKILSVLQLMLKQRDTNDQYTQKGYISVILGLIMYNYKLVAVENIDSTNIIIDLLMYIEDHYAEDISLDSLAKKFGYTAPHLSHLLVAHTQTNFREYLNIIRIQHMISMYRSGECTSIQALAYKCGYVNLQTFYNAFKKLYGLPPTEFFEQHLYDSIDYFKQKF